MKKALIAYSSRTKKTESMANYIARANAAALDLRDIMNRG